MPCFGDVDQREFLYIAVKNKTGIAILESNVAFSFKGKHLLTPPISNFPSWHIPKRKSLTCVLGDVHMNVSSNTIQNSKKIEMFHTSLPRK